MRIIRTNSTASSTHLAIVGQDGGLDVVGVFPNSIVTLFDKDTDREEEKKQKMTGIMMALVNCFLF